MKLTYIKNDNLVLVNGVAEFGNYITPTGFQGELQAIQWNETQGEYETLINNVYTNMPITEELYQSMVQDLYEQWNQFNVASKLEDETNNEIPVVTFEEVKADKLTQANALYSALSNRYVEINGVSLKQSFDIVTEWLTFAKFKEDSNLSIPAEAVMIDSIGNNMNSMSTPMIMGTMWQLTQYIMTLRAEHFNLLDRINAATTIPELEAIVTTIPV